MMETYEQQSCMTIMHETYACMSYQITFGMGVYPTQRQQEKLIALQLTRKHAQQLSMRRANIGMYKTRHGRCTNIETPGLTPLC